MCRVKESISFVVILAVCLLAMAASAFSQTSSAQYCSSTGHWYKNVVVPADRCWTDNRDSAATLGGYLVTISSQEEQDFINTNFADYQVAANIGAFEPNADNVWAWINGEPWNYTNWTPGQPDNSGDIEHYGGICWGDWCGNGGWNDIANCPTNLRFIAEFNYNPDSSAWCDDFEDGNGWQSRWTIGHGYPTLVGSPTHGGSGALQMVQQQTGYDCHSSVLRKGFAANTGSYSAWLMQEWDSDFELIIQSNKLDGDPFSGTGYRFQISAPHSGLPNGGFELVKNVAGTEVVAVPWAPVAFAINEWVKAFVVRKPGGVIIAGYEQTNGFRDSLIYVDPDPIEAPGAFYLWTCSDWGYYNYYDDACYQPLPPVQTAIWIDSTTVADGFTQVMMRNAFEVAAFTLPLLHDSAVPIDSVSTVGCRTANWQSFSGTSYSDSTLLIGGIANMGGGIPCMPVGEGPVARIFFPRACFDTFTVAFDTTYINEPGRLLVTDCSASPASYTPVFTAGAGTYETFLCGDINADCSRNIADVVYLIRYIFTYGAAPLPANAGDVNGDCSIDIADAVYYINWIFMGGPEPVCGCINSGLFAKPYSGAADVDYSTESGSETTSLTLAANCDRAIRGVQLEFNIVGDANVVVVASKIADLQEFHSTVNGVFKVGLLDVTGKTIIPAGQHDFVTITYASPSSARTGSEIKLVNAIVVGEDASKMNVTIKSVGSGSPNGALPSVFALSQNIPNPFNPSTEIGYALPNASQVRLEVLNILGQVVRTLVDEFQTAGDHKAVWDGRDDNHQEVSSGVYFYRVVAGEYAETRKMVLMK